MELPARLTARADIVVFDVIRGAGIALIEGCPVLPVGSVVELDQPAMEARIVGYRVQAPTHVEPRTEVSVIMEVEVPAAWWDAQERDLEVQELDQMFGES